MWGEVESIDLFTWTALCLLVFVLLIIGLVLTTRAKHLLLRDEVVVFFPSGWSVAAVDTVISLIASLIGSILAALMGVTLMALQAELKWIEAHRENGIAFGDFDGLSDQGFRYWTTLASMWWSRRLQSRWLVASMLFYLISLVTTGVILNQAAYPKVGFKKTNVLQARSFGYPNASLVVSIYNGSSTTGFFDMGNIILPAIGIMVNVAFGLNNTSVEDPKSRAVWPSTSAGAGNTTVNETWYNVTGALPEMTCELVPDPVLHTGWPPSHSNASIPAFSVNYTRSDTCLTQLSQFKNTPFIGMILPDQSGLYDTTDQFNITFMLSGTVDDSYYYDLPDYMTKSQPPELYDIDGHDRTFAGWAYVLNCSFAMKEVHGDCELIGRELQHCVIRGNATGVTKHPVPDEPGLLGQLSQYFVNGMVWHMANPDLDNSPANRTYPLLWTSVPLEINNKSVPLPSFEFFTQKLQLAHNAAAKTLLNSYYGVNTYTNATGYEHRSGIAFKLWGAYLMVFLLFVLFLVFIAFNYLLRSSPINAHANSPAMLLTTAASDPELLQELARTGGCKRQDVVQKVRDRRLKLGGPQESN
ncbi:hypothetical protein YB2330_006570 [Saitoella coloradoensis]